MGPEPPSIFAVLGVTPEEEELYRALVEAPRSTLAELATRTGRPPGSVGRRLRRLEGYGLVSRSTEVPGRYTPAPPDLAIEPLVLRRQEQLQLARLEARRMATHLHQGLLERASAQVVEVVTGADAVIQQAARLQLGAREEVWVADRPPYVTPGQPAFNEEELAMLAAGVRYRGLYDRDSLTLPGRLDALARYRAAGEEARVIVDLPVKLAIADRSIALIPISLDRPENQATIIVHPSPLLTALVVCFESLWARAIPLRGPVGELPEPPGAGNAPRPPEAALLDLLALGLKDEAIARHLGISVRTVWRRLEKLMADLGADTRFQAGLQAGRRGWL